MLLYGCWEISKRHLLFIDSAIDQGKLQTKSLDTIAGSSIRQEDRMDKILEETKQQDKERHNEHMEIMDALDKKGK